MPRFAANLSFLYAELPFLQRFAAAAADGFAAVEYLFPYEWPASRLRGILREQGLRQVLFNAPPGGKNRADVADAWQRGLRGTACLAGREDEFRYGVELALEYAQELDCPHIHVMSGIADPGDSRTQTRWLNNLAWAAERAAPHGLTVLIEPINRHDMPGYHLHTQQQAHAALDIIGHPDLGIQMDFYHCQRTEGDAVAELRRYLPGGRIRHAQIAGVPGRHEPDTGELDYRALLQLLDDAQWTGHVGCEYMPRGATGAGLGWLRENRQR